MPMTSGGNSSGRLRLTALRRDAPTPFDLRPDEPARRALADRLGLLALRKARLAGELIPGDGGSWRLVAELGATVVQACVVTLDPVTTRIDEPVERRFRPAQDMPRLDAGTEVEVPEEEEDPLPDVLDLTSVLTEAVSNNAVAVVVTPIAIGLAEHLGIDARALVVAVMIAASCSFATPIGYQTNTLIYGPGGYRFSDFLRVGVPLNLSIGLLASALIPFFFPL